MTILEYYFKKYSIQGNTLVDRSFDEMSFLSQKEPVYSDKGVKVSKSYVDSKGNEVIRIEYVKVLEDYRVNGVTYGNTFTSMFKVFKYFGFSGDVKYTKTSMPYIFNLDPVNDLQSNIVGYTSLKGEAILRNERRMAELKLKSRNPIMYNIVYTAYKTLIEDWKATGDATALISAIDNETDTTLLEVFNKIVEGIVDTTVGDYIKYVIS